MWKWLKKWLLWSLKRRGTGVSTNQLFSHHFPSFSFPSFNRKLCEATVSFFSKLSHSQTVFVLGRRVSVSMVHGRTQRVRAPFRGRARKIERRKNKEREIERHYTHSVQLVRHFHQLLVHLNANIFTLQIQNGSQISQTHCKKEFI